MGMLLTNMLQYTYHKAIATRSGTHWQVYCPVYLVAAANVMCMAMPMAVLFIYVGELNYPNSKMWHSGSWFPNTVHGVLLYLMKWIGTGFLMFGIMQVTRLHTKIKNRWHALRYGTSAKPIPGQVIVVSGKDTQTEAAACATS